MRVIAATNRNLRHLIDQGQFREDLFYRLNVIHLRIPPLRDRRADIPALVDHFLDKFSQKRGTRAVTFAPEAMQMLTTMRGRATSASSRTSSSACWSPLRLTW